VIGVQILRAQLCVAAHSIATVEFELSQVAVIGAITASQSIADSIIPRFLWRVTILYGLIGFFILGGLMMAIYLMNLMILPRRFNDSQL